MDIHPCQKLQTLLYSTLTLQIYDSIKYQNMIYQLTALVLQAKIAWTWYEAFWTECIIFVLPAGG